MQVVSQPFVHSIPCLFMTLDFNWGNFLLLTWCMEITQMSAEFQVFLGLHMTFLHGTLVVIQYFSYY